MADKKLLMSLYERELNENYLMITVHGCSMYPTINDGDCVKLEKCESVQAGDIIAYYLNQGGSRHKIVVHRVVIARGEFVFTKGDNNSFVDPVRVRIRDIVGKVHL